MRTITTTKDADGYDVEGVPIDVDVWADKISVKRSEFYSANKSDIDIVIAFNVHVEDYSEQKTVVYNSKCYTVERTYQIGEGVIELNCSDKVV